MSTELPPQVTPDMLYAAFWLARADQPDTPRLSAAAIAAFNARVGPALGLPAVLDLPSTLDVSEVRAALANYAPPQSARYGGDGQVLDAAYWQRLAEQVVLPAHGSIPVHFGLIVRRSVVRAWPTGDVVTSHPYEFALDRIQETTVDVGWPVAVVTTSRDGQWAFGLTPHYWGWVRTADIASGPRDAVAAYVNADPGLMTVASRGLVALADGGGVTPQMGTRLPLVETGPDAYRVLVPTRLEDGNLVVVPGWAAADTGDFVPGTLPATLHTLLTQAFRLLGEPYAWGGARLGIFGRDCSRFVRDVYAVTGLHLPRNGLQQARVCAEVQRFDPALPAAARKRALAEHVPPGAILVMPGHVLLYLGHCDGEPYAIHATSSSGYAHVIVSDLSLGAAGPSGPLAQRLTQAVIPA